MAQFGYTYRSISTYSSVRNDTRGGPVIKPFVPKSNNGNNSSEGHVTRKTIVPVTSSKPYGGSTTDGPATVQKYPSPSRARGDDDTDDEWHRKRSPVPGSPRKVDQFPSPTKVLQNETNRPQRFSPVANSTGWRHAPQPTPNYCGAEGRKPIGSGTNINNHDGCTNGTNYGYGGGNKEGLRKPIRPGTIRNDDRGGYNGSNNGYGGGNYAGSNKEGRKPLGSGNKNDKYEYDHGPNYGDHIHDRYNKKEVHKPMSTGLPIRTGNYDGYYGIGNGNNKEQRRPFGFGIGTIRKDSYDDDDDDDGNDSDDDDGEYYNNREGHNQNKHKASGATIGPKISSDWTAAPRRGTQLSEPTHDIDKALELLKMEAAKREHSISNTNKSGYFYDKPTIEPVATPNKDSSGSKSIDHRRRGGVAPRTFARDHDIIDSREAEKKFEGTRVW